MGVDFLTVEDVVSLHANQLELYGGDPGLRDRGLLESAVAQPRASYGHESVKSIRTPLRPLPGTPYRICLLP